MEREKEEEGGAVEVGGATVADVRQTPRQAVDENPSRAKGGRARAIGCVDCVGRVCNGQVRVSYVVPP